MVWLHVVTLLTVIFICGYFRTPSWVWAPSIALILLGFSLYTQASWLALTLYWTLFLAVSIIALLPPLRRKLLTNHLFRYAKRMTPKISQTEQEAIDAGDVWWEAKVFQGRADWSELTQLDPPKLSQAEQSFLDNQVNVLCDMLDEWDIVNHQHELPETVWNYLKQEKFLGLCIDKKYEGLGFSDYAHSTIIMKIATRSISGAISVMVPNSLGPGELLSHYGTDAQKAHYLPRLARGEEIPCFALTGPEAGSDAGSLEDKGVVCYGQFEGKEVLGVKLTWDKRYITLAPIATVLGLAFKLYDPDHLLSETENRGITLALIPTHHPGVEIGKRHLPMNMAFMNGPTSGKDVFIPLEWLIGGEAYIGKGWRMLMECLAAGRGISLPALATATGLMCYRTTGVYARIREQFKIPIGKFEGIEEVLAKIAGYTYLLEASRQMTNKALMMGHKPAVISAIVKYHTTELSRKIIEYAMDVHAGRALQMGPRNYLAIPYQAIPISITVEGANILTRNLIIFGQGVIRCHPYLEKETHALNNPDQKVARKAFDRLLFQHIGYGFSNFSRLLLTMLAGRLWIRAPHPGIPAKLIYQLTRLSTVLAAVSDKTLLLLGAQIKRKERLSARLGDVLSHLYLASTILYYHHTLPASEENDAHATWALQHCIKQAQDAFENAFENYPNRWVGRAIKWICFPLGMRFKGPSDELDHTLASQLLTPSKFREKLTQYMYKPTDKDDAVGRMEHVWKQWQDVQPIYQKMSKAKRMKKMPLKNGYDFETTVRYAVKHGVISDKEAYALREYETLKFDAISVDEFNSDNPIFIKALAAAQARKEFDA